MALIYFAHPIDFADGECQRQVDKVRSALGFCKGVATFDPGASWIVTMPMQPEIQQMNERVLHAASCVVAYLPTNVKTKGTIHEIAVSLERGVPVVLLVDDDFGKDSAYEVYLGQHKRVHKFKIATELNVAVTTAQHLAHRHEQEDGLIAKFMGDDGQLTRAHIGDAGFDLAYNGIEDIVIGAGERAAVPTGVRIELPASHYALIVGRSSSFSKRDLLLPVSVIDNGFRGELFAVCWNYGHSAQRIQPGERIAQLLPMRLEADLLRWVNAPLSQTGRGENGFGSSGR